ncbi:uncharacterized protein PSFLO_03417 [Pseudozyma flocculosa]|uniref:Autophagy-related protein 4 n=1 Tax=Pseudozyma flocculosa TaxID=84751 RepID=A0A5C3F1K6_9BASI|nr:uncharacterized protein PSFLO_03417 [Pseudozyma flocculosa]
MTGTAAASYTASSITGSGAGPDHGFRTSGSTALSSPSPEPAHPSARPASAAAPVVAVHQLADFDPQHQERGSPSSIASSSRIAVNADPASISAPRAAAGDATVVNRSRSSSVSAAIKATFHRPSTSSGSSSPAPSTKVKSRLRAGTWKGSGVGRKSEQSSRPELPSFDGSDRTPRASIYESVADPKQAEYSSSSSSSPAAVAAAPQPQLSGVDAHGGVPRRKLFGRSNSIRDMAKQGLPEPSNREGHNILRRIGSRSFFGAGSSKDAMRSTESLASSAIIEGAPSHHSSARQPDPARLGPASAWQRKKGRQKQNSDSDSIYSLSNSISELGPTEVETPNQAAVSPAIERESMESSHSAFSANVAGRAARASVGGDVRSEAHLVVPNHHASVSPSGLPKRLSGWLLNMMGNEAASAGTDSAAASANARRVDADGGSVRSASKSPSLGTSSPRATSPTKELEPPATSSALSTSPGAAGSSRAKTGSLLYSFTGGPHKPPRAGAPQGSGSTSSTSASTGVGAGWMAGGGASFDRALKYFLDTEAEPSEEGIWLLGVWHGPSADPQGGVQTPDEVSNETSGAASSLLDGQVERSDPVAAASADTQTEVLNDEAAAVHTPASVHASLPASSPQTASEDGFVLARNPPTPQTSPVKVRSFKGRSQPSSATNTIRSTSTEQSERSSSPATSAQHHPARSLTDQDWQAAFQADFSSRVWCTYRNNFGPIARDGTISEQAASAAALASAQADADAALGFAAAAPSSDRAAQQATSGGRSWLGRKLTESSVGRDGLTPTSIAASAAAAAAAGSATGLATSPTSLGEKMGITGLWGRATAAAQAAGFSRAGLTTDAGWGCMLRTGQSLLANALIDVHLGRSWMRRPAPVAQSKLEEQLGEDHTDAAAMSEFRRARKTYATYVKLLSWFLDDPSPACPFGVHRMAREGKRLGKEVGEWFGPSTAAGAIQALVTEFPEAGLGVALAHDGSVYLDEVRAAAVKRTSASRRRSSQAWQRPVLILIGIRLGLEGVNPMYYDAVKATFSFPQSVGIAGGRPSSSYYFMGHQGNSLFYLDPHHVRPAVPLRYPPSRFPSAASSADEGSPDDDADEWWAHAYSEQQLATFHSDKVRRMPIKSLDPSMLLGFLCKDEADLQDFCARVKAMPKSIFAFADSAPRWADDDDFDPSMESFSESSVGEVEDDRDSTEDEGADEDEVDRGGNLAEARSDRDGPLPFPSGQSRTREARDDSPSSTRPAMGHGDRTATVRPDSVESRHVSGSSEATTRAASRTRTGTGARRISSTLPAARHNRQAPSPVTGDESFSTISFSDTEVGSAWEEVSEGGTVAGGESHASAGRTEAAAPPPAETQPAEFAALDTPTDERNRPVLVTSSPSGYAVNGAPLSAATATQQHLDGPASTAHAPLRDLPRRRSRLDRSPKMDQEPPTSTPTSTQTQTQLDSPQPAHLIPHANDAVVAANANADAAPRPGSSSDVDDF